jgi:predicted MPP superfamily phosphohydrolase
MTRICRQDFLKFTGIALGGSVLTVTGFLTINNESKRVSVERINLPVKNLHPALEGYKIAQMSDFHLFPYTRPELIRAAVEITNKLNPDLIVLTEDYVWRNLEAVSILAPILAGLNASHGVYSIMGNHDIWTNVEVVREALRKVGLPVFENEGLTLSRGKGNIYLAGLEDSWSGHPDLNNAMAECTPNTPAVLLVHEPDVADEISLDPGVSLQFSGHSHGGHVCFATIAHQRYRCSLSILPRMGPHEDMFCNSK